MEHEVKRVDKQVLHNKILAIEYSQVGLKSTVCCLTLKSGFEIVGSSSPLRHEEYNQEIGEELAYNEAIKKLCDSEAYHILETEIESTPSIDLVEDLGIELEMDYRRCECFECDTIEDCDNRDCNDGCPHIECPQNEENDFQGYEDDGTEDYCEDCEDCEDDATYVITEKGRLLLKLVDDHNLSFDEALKIATEIYG